MPIYRAVGKNCFCHQCPGIRIIRAGRKCCPEIPLPDRGSELDRIFDYALRIVVVREIVRIPVDLPKKLRRICLCSKRAGITESNMLPEMIEIDLKSSAQRIHVADKN